MMMLERCRRVQVPHDNTWSGSSSTLPARRRPRQRQQSLPLLSPTLVALCSLALAFAVGGPPAASAFCVMALPPSVHVCTNTSCRKAGSRWTLDTFRAFAPPSVDVIETGCQGRCGLGPNVMTRPPEEVYNGVSQPATIAAIIEISFGFPVSDALVGAFGHASEGDVLYQRGLHAEALACYSRCVATAGAFEGNGNALSVAKMKQSTAMRMVAKDVGRKSSGSGEASAALEEAEVSAREAIKLWRANTAAWLHLCDVLVDTGRVDVALDLLAQLKAEFPEAKFEASEKAAWIRNSR
ncbi:unnamed protein product [Laminaria digitata]